MRWHFEKARRITHPPPHENWVHLCATIVFICGDMKGIVANVLSQLFFSSQYMDFTNALGLFSFGWFFVESPSLKKACTIFLPSCTMRPHPSINFTRRKIELDCCLHVINTIWQNNVLPSTSLFCTCNYQLLYGKFSCLGCYTSSLHSIFQLNVQQQRV